MEKKFPLKRLNEALRGFVTNRRRIVRFILAIVAVVLLSGILSALILIQVTSDYQTNGTVPSPVALEQQTNGSIPSPVALEQQTNGSIPSPVTSKQQTSGTVSEAESLKTIAIGAYWDDNLTSRVNGIDWGILEPGGQKNFVIYFHNEGDFAVTLSMSTSNWNPSVASTYLTLSWDYNGQTINVGENLQVTLTLSVSANITGITDFDFDIIIVGSG